MLGAASALPKSCALALVLAFASARAADAPAASDTSAPSPAPATATGNATMAPMPRPRLPLDFADFVSDYKPKDLRQEWLTVEVGELETFNAPPEGMTSFVMPEDIWNRQQLSVTFKPMVLTCVVGSKARFDNLMMLEVDKANNPLGYSLPLGQLVYFLAMREANEGMVFSIHYYHAEEVRWIPNPNVSGSFMPVTSPTILTQDAVMPAEDYAFLYLSQRSGPVIPGAPTPPKTLYRFLVVHIHRLTPPAPPLPTGVMLPPGK